MGESVSFVGFFTSLCSQKISTTRPALGGSPLAMLASASRRLGSILPFPIKIYSVNNSYSLRYFFAGWENRTPNLSLENWYFTIKLIPQLFIGRVYQFTRNLKAPRASAGLLNYIAVSSSVGVSGVGVVCSSPVGVVWSSIVIFRLTLRNLFPKKN